LAKQSFQAFTVKANGRVDRITTDIAVLPAFDPKSPPTGSPARMATKALWDTGATKSVVSTDLVKALGLTPVGVTRVNHAGGVSMTSTYVVNFELPHRVVVAGILATEFPAGANGFGAIVGMDVICHGDLAITNVAGQTWFSFRTPHARPSTTSSKPIGWRSPVSGETIRARAEAVRSSRSATEPDRLGLYADVVITVARSPSASA
jgi:hypothetical protein